MNKSFLHYLKLLPLFTILLILAGCAKDEIDSPLNGKWEGISFTTSEPVDEDMDGTAHTDLKQEMECVSILAEFTSRGNFSITSTDVTYDISIVDGKVVLTPTGCSPYIETGNWFLNEASTILYLEIKIQGKDEPTLVGIAIELNNQRLVMKDLPYDDAEEITYTVEFKKV